MNNELYEHLAFLYGSERSANLYPRLENIISQFRSGYPQFAKAREARVSEQDAILITYGDMVQDGATPLHTLAEFLQAHLVGLVSGVHFLPFFPYTSDDGFSVVDYWAIDSNLGNWDDVAQTGRHFRLMFDAVINHISAHSAWFQGFLHGNTTYQDYFIAIEPDADLSQVFRPRALPLLTEVETTMGNKHVWTTFSADQIDLNFANPDVLLKIIELLLFYVTQGAEFIRLDAIGFMWKEIGTTCLHLPQAHRAIQLMRSVLNLTAPRVALITETNVPHAENVSYFGNGRNEAQLVYNFSLPPLTLHAFHTGNAETLSRWAETLTLPSNEVTFFNFLASHDGIGLTPARGILDETAVANIVQRVQQLGGHVSFKNNPDGSQSAYELNINYLDALCDPDKEEPIELIARRFLASQAIMLALRGVPGIYFHSLFGSRSWPEGVQESGRFRTINRQKLQRDQLEQELADPHTLRHHVFNGYARLLRQRTVHPAFHPNGGQEVLALHPALFALRRTSVDGTAVLLCLHNVSSETVSAVLPHGRYTDLLAGGEYEGEVGVRPYQVLWLQKE
ncbi:MAG: sugar phosphorylase [Anaerolineales bacterium]|nr:sugar phosphorylase [Anaerolineales bacterium]